jgi:hypothetical protein
MNFKLSIAITMVDKKTYEFCVFGEFDSLNDAVKEGVKIRGGIYGRPIKWHNKPITKKTNRKGNLCRW